MKYLVLRSFRSFGKTLTKGSVVDAADIRSPYLRVSEGKIILAVSSSQVPVEFGTEEPAPQALVEDVDTAVNPVLYWQPK